MAFRFDVDSYRATVFVCIIYHRHGESHPSVVFQLGQEVYKVSGTGIKSEASDIIFFTPNLLNEEFQTVDWFKKCSKLKIRINESYCTTEYYEFNMSKSSSALDFMSKP